MGYYRTAGDYYRGDYYRGDVRRSAGGFLATIGKIAGLVAPLIPGGGIVKTLLPFATAISKTGRSNTKFSGTGGLPAIPPIVGGPRPGAARAAELQGMGFGRKRRRMNPANAKALRRAIRREQSFVALAKRVLKGTGITVGRHSFARTKRKR